MEKDQMQHQNIKTQASDYSLIHVIAADLWIDNDVKTESGVKQSKVAILRDNNRYIYYVIMKRKSNGKPNYDSLWNSLWSMKEHMTVNQVKKVGIPKIGCGWSPAEWDCVKDMFQHLFKELDVENLVYSRSSGTNASRDASPHLSPNQNKKCEVIKTLEENPMGASYSKGNVLSHDTSSDKKADFAIKEPKKNKSDNENWRKEIKKNKCEQQFDLWEGQCNKKMELKIVHEINGDLFKQSPEYSLAHCVAADFQMSKGIGVLFQQKFRNVDALLDQNVKAGGVAILPDRENARYIYYLVIKNETSEIPIYKTLWKSLWSMRIHMEEKEVNKLAIPRIGCGFNRLDWNLVKNMLEYLFNGTDIEIRVCNFQDRSHLFNNH